MPTIEEVAPELSTVLDQTQAEMFVDTSVGSETNPTYVTVSELGATKLNALLLWLKWYRAKTVPSELAELQSLFPDSGLTLRKLTKWFLRLSPKVVAFKLGMDLAYLQSMIDEVAKIRAELAREEDAWMPAAVTPVIEIASVDTPGPGDLTLSGHDFDSYATKTTYVQLTREGVGSVTRTQAEIESGGGLVSATQIVVPASIIPAGGPQAGDVIRVRADGLDSVPFVIGE